MGRKQGRVEDGNEEVIDMAFLLFLIKKSSVLKLDDSEVLKSLRD